MKLILAHLSVVHFSYLLWGNHFNLYRIIFIFIFIFISLTAYKTVVQFIIIINNINHSLYIFTVLYNGKNYIFMQFYNKIKPFFSLFCLALPTKNKSPVSESFKNLFRTETKGKPKE